LFATFACGMTSANLMPASGHQDHTTSPSASTPFVIRCICVHRILPLVDDVGQRPSAGKDARISAPDLPDGTSEIFFAGGLDGANQLDPLQQFVPPKNGSSQHAGPLMRETGRMDASGSAGIRQANARLRSAAPIQSSSAQYQFRLAAVHGSVSH
jgi:hypothetical protein